MSTLIIVPTVAGNEEHLKEMLDTLFINTQQSEYDLMIIKNDYNLSHSRYKKIKKSNLAFESPQELLNKIIEREQKIMTDLKILEKLTSKIHD